MSTRGMTQVRLVGEGKNEIVSIGDAFEKADQEGLDLVLVSNKGNPPVVRIEDFKKLQYEAKKAKAKHSKSTGLKEIQLKLNISDHDLQTKVSAIGRFLERGDKVKVTVRLKGRERENPERARALLGRIQEQVDCKATRMPGPIAIVILEPNK